MDVSDKEALRAAIARLAEVLHFNLPGAIKDAYLSGFDTDRVGYEKLVGHDSKLIAFGKYVLVRAGASSDR